MRDAGQSHEAAPPAAFDAEPVPDPREIGSAARACLVILALGLVLVLIACVILVARPDIGG